MRLSIQHLTRYDYSAPVAVSQQLMHLKPRETATQRCIAHRLDIDPAPGEYTEEVDYFGNAVARMLLARPHSSLSVRAESEVHTAPQQTLISAAQPAWEVLREALRADPAHRSAVEHIFESPHVRRFPELLRYALPSFPPGREVLAGARDLMRRIHGDFAFDPSATTVATPLEEVLRMRRGVCQDFAHLMLGCLRSLGLAARYVSGYLLTDPPPGRPRLVGADASHAWVSLYLPGGLWVDMDPTNDCYAGEGHATLAWGRDFSDAMPMRGIILGGGEQTLGVSVTVAPLDGEP